MQIMNTGKEVLRRARPNSDGLRRCGLPVLLIAVILLASAAIVRTALAADNLDQLFVTGVIKSVNAGTGIVMVDVTSSSCHGMRIFKADKPDILEDYIEQRVSFFINSNRCEVKEVYTILVERGLRK